MILYDFQGNKVPNKPKKVFRGLDILKDNTHGIRQIEKMFKRGSTPSYAVLIDQGKFDFNRLYQYRSPQDIEQRSIEKYISMIKQNSLNVSDIDDELRFNHLQMLPSPLVSVTTSMIIAAGYSGWIKRPIVVYSTANLEGVDFKPWPQDRDQEIGIFKELPTQNITDIIYFYENQTKLQRLLKTFNRSDIKLHKGFLKPEFRYKTFSGKWALNIPYNLELDNELQIFYKTLEQQITA